MGWGWLNSLLGGAVGLFNNSSLNDEVEEAKTSLTLIVLGGLAVVVVFSMLGTAAGNLSHTAFGREYGPPIGFVLGIVVAVVVQLTVGLRRIALPAIAIGLGLVVLRILWR